MHEAYLVKRNVDLRGNSLKKVKKFEQKRLNMAPEPVEAPKAKTEDSTAEAAGQANGSTQGAVPVKAPV